MGNSIGMLCGNLINIINTFCSNNIVYYIFVKPDGSSMSCKRDEIGDLEKNMSFSSFTYTSFLGKDAISFSLIKEAKK